MKLKRLNKPLSFLLVLAMFVFLGNEMYGQNFLNGSTGTIKNAGTIRFVDNAAEFQNENTTFGNTGGAYDAEFASPTSGTIEITGTTLLFNGGQPLGADNAADANRVSGWVHYASGSAQTIQGVAYRNLGLSGAGGKDYGAVTTYVDLEYFVDGTSGTRNYGTSSFYYDGDVAATEDQNIFGEGGTAANDNAYYYLGFLNSGVKTLQQGDEAYAYNEVNFDGSATNVTVLGHLSAKSSAVVNSSVGSVVFIGGDADGTLGEMAGPLEDGAFSTNDGVGTLAGAMYIYDEGTFITEGTGLQTVTGVVTVGTADLGVTYTATSNSGSFTLQSGDATFDTDGELSLADADGHIVAGDGRTLTFVNTGEFTNAVAYVDGTNERPNMEFHLNSTVAYTGGSATGDVVGAGSVYPYGNLVVNTATNHIIESGWEANVAGDFTLDQADLWADADQDPDTDNGSSETLVMLTETSAMNYTDQFEVVGAVARNTAGTSTTMTFNNTTTLFGVPDTPGSVTQVKLSVWKGEDNISSDFNNATDVSRRLKFEVTESAQDWSGYLRYGFLASESPATTTEFYQSLRYREYDQTGPSASEKTVTGQPLLRGEPAGADFGYVDIHGIETNAATPAIADPGGSTIADGGELFLRGGPTWFITINPGRWSNPDTWDEAEQPGPNDLCLVRHTVWAGFVNQLDNFTTNEDVWLTANFTTDETELASYVAIYNNAAEGYKGALLFGQSNPASDNASTHMVDPQWGFKEDGTDLSGWSVAAIDDAIVQGKLHIQAKDHADAVNEVPDATLELSHYPDGSDMPAYHGGLFVFGQSGTSTNPTQFTVPTILENNFIVKNYGLLIIGQ